MDECEICGRVDRTVKWTTVPGFHDLSTPELFNILADPAVAGVYVHSTRSPDVKRIR